MRIISIVIYNFSPLPSVIFSAGGAENDYLYLRGAVFLPPAAAKTLANLQSANGIILADCKIKKAFIYADEQYCNLQFFSAAIRHFLRRRRRK